jgi:hypothetical protein
MTPLLRPLLALFLRDIIDDSAKQILKREAVSQVADSVRQEFLRTVAEGYAREVTHNISQYVRSVEAVSVEISSEGYGEKLYTAFQKSLKDLETKLEQQGPDSPVIKYFEEKYGKREESVVGRKPKPVYTMFSGPIDANRPWLSSSVLRTEDSAISDILANEAARLFDRIFTPPEVF